jgi:hypothetical protein
MASFASIFALVAKQSLADPSTLLAVSQTSKVCRSLACLQPLLAERHKSSHAFLLAKYSELRGFWHHGDFERLVNCWRHHEVEQPRIAAAFAAQRAAAEALLPPRKLSAKEQMALKAAAKAAKKLRV